VTKQNLIRLNYILEDHQNKVLSKVIPTNLSGGPESTVLLYFSSKSQPAC